MISLQRQPFYPDCQVLFSVTADFCGNSFSQQQIVAAAAFCSPALFSQYYRIIIFFCLYRHLYRYALAGYFSLACLSYIICDGINQPGRENKQRKQKEELVAEAGC